MNNDMNYSCAGAFVERTMSWLPASAEFCNCGGVDTLAASLVREFYKSLLSFFLAHMQQT